MRKPYQRPDFHLLPGVPGMTGEALAALSDEELEKTLRDNGLEEKKSAIAPIPIFCCAPSPGNRCSCPRAWR